MMLKVIYNALPRKEYERIFMCKIAKEIYDTLLITHQGNSQVKDNKIDLLVQQYEQFTIPKEELIDNAFARFNTIITSLKALDEGFSSKNYVKKFLRALHPKWRAKTEGPYHTDLPTPDKIRPFLLLERTESNHTIKSKNVILTPNQILTKELRQDMKRWEELIHENVFGLRGHQDHLPASLAHMLYCIVAEEQYNLAYFFVKRIECARATLTANLLYGMFLTHLFRYIMEHYPCLDNGIYNVVDRVMRPLALKQTQKPRSGRGMSKTHHYGSSSHHG
ncbi:hypothetical protein Tco_1034676 [Tanacetum coccineum]